jgi:purine-binding chemotaxis protein CheW
MAKPEAAEVRKDKVDFKMVTFSLAGKEYGIDIMSVKEIAKAGRFTYVPNAAPFVRGVYNLRGEIISVVDLRIFFHLPAERKAEDSLESLLILRVEEHVFGVIVDGIDKVVGISSASIQPPHPIFGDINVKYIKGIVENGGKLYIILDVARIFAPPRVEEEKVEAPQREAAGAAGAAAAMAYAASSQGGGSAAAASSDVASSFVRETLATFKGFHVTGLNEAWFQKRFGEWKKDRAGQDVQLHEASEAEEFLEGFWSSCSGKLWEEDYARAFMATLPDIESKSINIWNPGCGKGYESWSLACVLKKRYPETRIKVWANDSDLLAISMAPNMVFPENIPDFYADFMQSGRNGLSFIQAIRDSIFFEFHDALNPNPLPPLDFILCRDMLSLMAPGDQKHLLEDFGDKLKPVGLLYLGENEAPGAGWGRTGAGAIAAYRKES